MPESSVVISVVALAVSVAGLTVASLNYLRDRSNIRVWCEVGWHELFDGKPTAILRLRIANLGRRPVVILNLVKEGNGQRWWRPIRKPELDGAFTLERLRELRQQSLAHLAGVKLGEGDVMDFEFLPEDMHEFYFTASDPIAEATHLFIEDISGRRYAVKDSNPHLKTMFHEWRKTL